MILIISLVSAVIYLFVWRVPRVGKQVTLTLVTLQLAFYTYAIIPTESFYVELVERNSGIKLVGDVDVRWGWASRAYAFPNIYSDRAVDVLIISEDTDVDSARPELRYSDSDCRIGSAKVRAMTGLGALDYCWKGLSSSARDNIYLAVSADYKTVYFWQR